MRHALADPTELGRSLSDELQSRVDDFTRAAVEDLGIVRRDAIEEVSTVMALLEELKKIQQWTENRQPICRPEEEVAFVLAYNMIAWQLWDVAALLVADNEVRVRLSGRARTLAELTQETLGQAFGELATIDLSSRESFLRGVLDDPSVPLLIAYGSESLGASLLTQAQGSAKKFVFEGPGKDRMIVLKQADIPEVVRILRRSKFQFAGQQCTATEILLVQQGIYQEVIEATKAMMDEVCVGEPSSLQTDIGPLGSPRIAPAISRQNADAVDKGTTLVSGGDIDGSWVGPTLVTDLSPEMSLWRDETFGPVLGMASFSEAREAVALTSRFGLHCIVCGPGAGEVTNLLRGRPYAHPVPDIGMQAYGTVSVDRPLFSHIDDYLTPFGGYGVSGWIWDGRGLLQGPKILAREATVP